MSFRAVSLARFIPVQPSRPCKVGSRRPHEGHKVGLIGAVLPRSDLNQPDCPRPETTKGAPGTYILHFDSYIPGAI